MKNFCVSDGSQNPVRYRPSWSFDFDAALGIPVLVPSDFKRFLLPFRRITGDLALLWSPDRGTSGGLDCRKSGFCRGSSAPFKDVSCSRCRRVQASMLQRSSLEVLSQRHSEGTYSRQAHYKYTLRAVWKRGQCASAGPAESIG